MTLGLRAVYVRAFYDGNILQRSAGSRLPLIPCMHEILSECSTWAQLRRR